MDRQELLKAARGKKISSADHLAACEECREAVRLLQVFHVAGELPLDNAPEGWIKRAAAIADKPGIPEKVKRLTARLVFDSWTLPQPAGVRGTYNADHRRLRFEAGGLDFNIRVERYKGGWACIAQVTGSAAEKTPLRLHVGRGHLLPDSGGLYQWSAKSPPKKLTFSFDDSVIELSGLTWTRPRKT